MKKFLFVFAFLLTQSSWALNLEQPELDKIFAASYEVVIAKPTKETVEYERKLPMNLLPYQYRTDKYYSVGSAFRIDGEKFVSAAHVFGLGSASQNKDMGIRDGNGKIYPIDKIYKYSKARDFVVFTVKGMKAGKSFKINTEYSKNKKVYAVGNALGEGVVIRDGLYTSNTPEEESGEWKWIRFSAAASPGNSGGPLLDDKGNVIGVILRKSESENLNYALPMREVLKFEQVAELKSNSVIYKINISNDTLRFNYNRRHKLPMSIEKIDIILQNDMQEIFENAAKDFLKEHEARLFPNDAGSMPILYNRYTSFFPSIIIKGSDKVWDILKPKSIKAADTGNGGQVNFGKMGNFYYLKIKRPNNVDVNEYYSNSKILMDQILKGINYNRRISQESIRIVSMGKSVENRLHIDSFGRKWQVKNWLVSFSDQKFVLYALPTPDGYAIMMSITDTGDADMMEIDMKIIINNLYYTYYGTLDDWSAFLQQKNITPDFIKNISIDTDQKSYIQYKDKNFNFRVDNSTMKISKDSDIQLRCSYYNDNGKVVWAPAMVIFGENKNTPDYASVSRNIKPPKILDERYRSRWGDITEQRTPYNHKTYMNDRMSNITMLRANDVNSLIENDVIYAISWHEQGTIDHKIMESKLNGLNSNFKLFD